MKKDQVLKELENVGVIHRIEQDYFITKKAKLLFYADNNVVIDKYKDVSTSNKSKILDQPTLDPTGYPEEVDLATSDTSKVVAFLDACEVPSTDEERTYRIRGLDRKTIEIVYKFVTDTNTYKPSILMKAVSSYYKCTEKPKAVKGLFDSTLIDELYKEASKGGIQEESGHSPTKKNWRWG